MHVRVACSVCGHLVASTCTSILTVGTYAFRFKGKRYVSDRLRLSSTEADRSAYEPLKDSLDSGTPVSAWVNPNDPRQSALELDGPGTAWYVASAVFLIFGAAMLCCAFCVFRCALQDGAI